MNKIIKYIFLTFLTIGFLSCNDSYFEKVDPNNVAEENFWKTEKDAVIGITGVYSSLQNGTLYGNLYREFDALSEIASMNNNASGVRAFETGEALSNSPLAENVWTAWYTTINRANLVADKVSKMTNISEPVRKRIIAECSFFRGLSYLHLTSLYGAVPLLKDAPTSQNKGAVRTSVADIYAFIISDLNANIPNLPLTVPAAENGRLTQMAAQTLLGKFYLYQKNWQAAAGAFKKVIDSKLYSLYPDYTTYFTPVGEFSKENLFEVVFQDGPFGEGESFSFNLDSTLALITPLGGHVGITDYANSFLATDGETTAKSKVWKSATPHQNRDPRYRATLLTNDPADLKIWRRVAANPFACRKYGRVTSQVFLGGPQNFYVFRYADVLLMYAEAVNEATGPNTEVYNSLKVVRDRVKMPNLVAGLSQTAMRDAIRTERLWELGFEGIRYYDLRRWGLLETIFTKGAPGFAKVTQRKFTPNRDEFWPIPQREIDNNPQLKPTDQNQGY